MFHAKLRKVADDKYKEAINRYNSAIKNLGESINVLYKERKHALDVLKLVEERINRLSKTPKEFTATLQQIEVEVKNFEGKQQEIKKAEIEVTLAKGAAGAGATLSALGVAVATMGPTAAMGIATTFGVSSTGTAISTLSGAAATNAALAWLGGGALAAGGGGMSAGSAFLGLAGPVGWTIAGVMFAGFVGSGLFTSHKNQKEAEKLIEERTIVEDLIKKCSTKKSEVEALSDSTIAQITGVKNAEKTLIGNDYSQFTKDEKIQAGLLVNLTLTLAQLINKELKVND